MKILIPILIGLLVVGCGKKQSTSTSEKVSKPASAIEPTSETPSPTEPYIAKRNLKPEDVIGTYEKQVEEGNVFRMVFLKDGNMEFYSKGKKLDKDSVLGSNKWRIEGSEIRTSNKDENGFIYTIENNGDLTLTGLLHVVNGRMNYSKDELDTYNRVKDAKPTSGKKETPSKGDDKNSTTVKPVKELTLEEKVVGEYEYKSDKNTYRWIFLDNGILENYTNGKNQVEAKWSIVNKEIHVDYGIFTIFAYRINEDKSITQIAAIEDGKRTDLPKAEQSTYKKIKSEKETPSKGDDKNSTTAKPVKELTLEEKVVGEYESIYNGKTYKRVFQENGIVEWYVNGRKRAEYKLEIVNGEIRAAFGDVFVSAFGGGG